MPIAPISAAHRGGQARATKARLHAGIGAESVGRLLGRGCWVWRWRFEPGCGAVEPRGRAADSRARYRDGGELEPVCNAEPPLVGGSAFLLVTTAEDAGFEPARACTQHAFQVAPAPSVWVHGRPDVRLVRSAGH